MFLLPVALIVCAVWMAIGFQPIITRSDVDSELSDIWSQNDYALRVSAYTKFFDRIRNAYGYDRLESGAMGQIAAQYIETHNQGILEAMDKTRLDAGFGHEMCDMYAAMTSEREFIEYYTDVPERILALDRCRGITFSHEGLPWENMYQ